MGAEKEKLNVRCGWGWAVRGEIAEGGGAVRVEIEDLGKPMTNA